LPGKALQSLAEPAGAGQAPEDRISKKQKHKGKSSEKETIEMV